MKNIALLFVFISIKVFSQNIYQRDWSKVNVFNFKIFNFDSNNENLYLAGGGSIYKINAQTQNQSLVYQFPTANIPTTFDAVVIENFTLDNSGNIIIYGRTHNNLLATPGVYSQTPITTVFTGYTFIAKLNASGTLLWFTYFHDLIQNAFTLTVDKNNNIYVGSYRNRDDVLSSNAFQQTGDKNSVDIYQQVISKINPNGQHVWSTFYQNGGSKIRNIIAGDTGIYIYGDHIGANNSNFFGTKNSFQEYSSSLNANGSASTAFLSKLDFNGNRLWSTYFGDQVSKAPTHFTDVPYSMAVIGDDVFILTELQNIYTPSQNHSTPNAFLTQQTSTLKNTALSKFNTSGQRVWTTYVHGGNSVFKTQDNNLLISGNIYETYSDLSNVTTNNVFQQNHGGNYDIYISIISNDGNKLLYGTLYGLDGDDNAIAFPSKNGHFVYGITKLNPQAYNYFDTTGKVLTRSNLSPLFSGIFISYFKLINLSNEKNTLNIKTSVYPNPATNILNIISDQILDDNTVLTVYDLNGRKLLSKKYNDQFTNTIDIHQLQSGVYILKIENDNFKQSHKFIKK